MKKTEHPLYKRWGKIKERCHNPNSQSYPRYGGRGISMCKEWCDDFWIFVKEMGL